MRYKKQERFINNDDLNTMVVINNLLAEGKPLTRYQKIFWNKNIKLVKAYFREINNYWSSLPKAQLPLYDIRGGTIIEKI